MFSGRHVFTGTDEPRCVSFASDITVLDNSLDIVLHDPLCPDIVDEDDMDTVCATTDITAPIVRPPPGFRQFSGLPGWFPWRYGEQPVDQTSLPVSPILQGSLDDSVIANVGSSNTPSETVVVTQPVGDALPVETDSKALLDSPWPDVVGTFSELPLVSVADSPRGMTNHGSRRSLGGVPRWRLAREGPFLYEKMVRRVWHSFEPSTLHRVG